VLIFQIDVLFGKKDTIPLYGRIFSAACIFIRGSSACCLTTSTHGSFCISIVFYVPMWFPFFL